MRKMRRNRLSGTRRRILAAAILAGLSVLPSHALADDTEVPVETVYHNGEKFAEIGFFPEDVGLGKKGYWFIKPAIYTLSEKLQKATGQKTKIHGHCMLLLMKKRMLRRTPLR